MFPCLSSVCLSITADGQTLVDVWKLIINSIRWHRWASRGYLTPLTNSTHTILQLTLPIYHTNQIHAPKHMIHLHLLTPQYTHNRRSKTHSVNDCLCLFEVFHTETLRGNLFSGAVYHCESYLNYSVLLTIWPLRKSKVISSLYLNHRPPPPLPNREC